MARQQTKKTQVGETQDDDTVAAEGQAEAEQAQTPTAEQARQQTKKTQVGETQDDDTVAAEGQAEAEQAQTPTAEQARKESKSGSGTRYQTPNGNLITSR